VLFIPIAGRTTDEWLPVLIGWFRDGIFRGHRFVSPEPSIGETRTDQGEHQLSGPLRGVVILTHELPGSESGIGVLKDRSAGTYTGVMSVRGRSFALLDGPEKSRRLASWAGILSGLAREGGLVHRLQWVERTVPDPGDDLGTYLKENIAVPLDSLIARSYLQVVDDAGPVTQQHETLVALQIHAGRSQRAIKQAGGGDHGACEVLRRELASLATRLIGDEVVVEGVLTPRLLAASLRHMFDPRSRHRLARLGASEPEREGTSLSNTGPMATDASWSSFRSDGAVHTTYWIAEWPRLDVEADFLAPLLLRTECMRSASLVMEPISPLKAIRSVESARTSVAADDELRSRAGFVRTARRSREEEALASHERELSDGHAFYRFAGFITVTANDEEELGRACGEVEEAAARSFLDVRRLYGQQENAFTYTLPLGRGLR
jgi:hypothetical protein